MFIHHTGQYFSPDSRARVDVSPRRYKKIAINHEVRRKCSSLKIYTFSVQIVRLLPETGTCSDSPGLEETFDDCIQVRERKVQTS